MRKKPAFRFFDELIGDYIKVNKMIHDPKMLFVESGVNTLNMAVDVYSAIVEHIKTKNKADMLETVKERYDEYEEKIQENQLKEAAYNADIEFEKIKIKVQKGQFNDRVVRSFIDSLVKNLRIVNELFQNVQIEPDSSEMPRVEEVVRRTIRDLKNLISIYIEEDKQYGKNQS